MSSRHVLEGSPFAFLVRSMHIAPCRGREYDSKEVLYDGEVETCVVDPGSDVGSPSFVRHVLKKLSMLCMDVRCVILVGCAWMLGRLKPATQHWSK